MFKSNKDSNIDYVNKDEVDKMYEHQKKLFDSKIEAQQEKIDELVDCISARFGEDLSNSNITSQIKDIENKLKSIDIKFKAAIEENKNALEQKIQKEGTKFVIELNRTNDNQTETYKKYEKLLEGTQAEIANLQNAINSKKSETEDLAKYLQEYIKNEQLYKGKVKGELEETNKKIGKINYLGISNKFDKKLKDESGKLVCKIKEENGKTRDGILKTLEDTKTVLESSIGQVEKKANDGQIKLGGEISNIDKKIDQNSGRLEELSDEISLKISNLEQTNNQKIGELIEKTDKNEDKITKLNASVKKELEAKGKEITEVRNENNSNKEELLGELAKLDAGIKQELEAKKNEIAEARNENNTNNQKLVEKITKLEEDHKQKDKAITNIAKKTDKNSQAINEELKNTNSKIDSLTNKFEKQKQEQEAEINKFQGKIEEYKQEILEQVAENGEATQANKAEIENINERIGTEAANFQSGLQNNEKLITDLEEKLNGKLDEVKQQNKESIEKTETKLKEKNSRTEEKIKLIKEGLKGLQVEVKTQGETLKGEIDQINLKQGEFSNKAETISTDLENSKQQLDVLEQKSQNLSEKFEGLKAEVNKQLVDKTSKEEINQIKDSIEEVKTESNEALAEIAKQIEGLRQETLAITERQEINNINITKLRANYSNYAQKVDTALEKIGVMLSNAQKKNTEADKNLQIKIKAYIDNKIETTNNKIKNVEELINKANLSIAEKEKLQNVEMEKLLNKKLKEIQKENERLLNKKIEEINNSIRQGTVAKSTNTGSIAEFTPAPKKKKSVYDVIDTSQMLKQTATTKDPLAGANTGKSQILKFFYDDEDTDLN